MTTVTVELTDAAAAGLKRRREDIEYTIWWNGNENDKRALQTVTALDVIAASQTELAAVNASLAAWEAANPEPAPEPEVEDEGDE